MSAMSIRNCAAPFILSALALMSSASAFAQAPAAAPPAAPPAGAAPPADAQQPQFSINQTVGDWVVRCVLESVKSPAPCDMLQVTINQQNKQRVSSFSVAYVPSRDSYAMQIIVPTGVALSKGLVLAAGAHSLNGAKFNRCERDGCYVELLTDTATITALSGVGKTTQMTVVGYGTAGKTVPLPVSLTGFPEALDRMKSLAKARAIAAPNPPPPPAAAAAPPPAAAPARPAPPAARPAPAARAAAKAAEPPAP
jgi:invasion protein IalB